MATSSEELAMAGGAPGARPGEGSRWLDPQADLALHGVEVAPDSWVRKDDTGRAMAMILSGLAALVFAVLAPIAVLSAADGAPAAALAAIAVSCVVGAALFSFLALRLSMAGVMISAGEVRLRGILRTRRLPADEVERFEPGFFSSVPLRDEVGVRIVRRGGGRDLDVWALGGGPVEGDGELEARLAALEPICEELNELLAEAAKRTKGA